MKHWKQKKGMEVSLTDLAHRASHPGSRFSSSPSSRILNIAAAAAAFFSHRAIALLLLVFFTTFTESKAQTTEAFTSSPTFIAYPGVPSWKQIAEVTIDGVVYQISNSGNGGWAFSSSGGESNSSNILYSTAATSSVTIKRKDNARFQFYGVWLKYTNFTSGYSAPWLSVTYSGSGASSETFGANTQVTLSKNLNVTSVTLMFSGLYNLNFDNLIVGPALASLPTVATATPAGVGGTYANLGGSISSDGGGTITEKGIVWSTSPGPTTAGNKLTMGTGSSAFSSQLTGLSLSTTYYVKAYAINSAGTSYGSELSFSTTDGTGPITLNPSMDTYIDIYGSYPNDSEIYAGDWDGWYSDIAMKFNLAVASLPISTAKLRIYVSSKGSESNIYLKLWGSNNDSWAASTTTLPSQDVALAGQTPVTSGWMELDITSFIQAQLGGDKVASLVITGNPGPGDVWFGIRSDNSSTNKPELVITPGPANAAPVATAPTAPTVTEDDSNVALADNIHVSDGDSDDQTVTFTVTGGTVTLGTSGITFGGSGNGSSSFTASGTLVAVNAALDAATFTPTPNLSGSNVATIAFKSNDGTVDSNTASVTFSIAAVNDDPYITGLPTDVTVTEDVSTNFDISAATFGDPDAGSGLVDITFTASAGTFQLAASGLLNGFSGNATNQVTLNGTAANLESYLNIPSNLKYTGAANVFGNDAATVTIAANDNGNTGTGGGTTVTLGIVNVDITAVNDAPVASNVEFSGTLQVGALLTGSYDYSDVENDTETGTTFKWYSSIDNVCSEAEVISGATSITYTLQAADEGKFITFEVTPHDGTTAGYNSISSRLGPVVLPAPVIEIQGNDLLVANGDVTPSASDHTDFGGVVAAAGTTTRTFTIKNTGTASLELADENGRGYVEISGPNAADFTVTSAPSSGSIGIGGSNSFVIEFNPSAKGDRSATVRVASNDTDKTPYSFAVKGTGLNTAPAITSAAAFSVSENQTTVATLTGTDADADVLSYSITGGADQSKFNVNSGSGALTFQTAPDFESPSDADADNVYEVQVTVHDGTVGVNQSVAVTVTDVNDNAPVITSASAVSVAENQTAVLTVTATDADAGTAFTFSISGGADASSFSVNSSTGVLTFLAAPDFEAPGDANTDNQYLVEVAASDGTNSSSKTVTVTVTDENDNSPVFTSSSTVNVAENETSVVIVVATDADAATTISYSISGGADHSKFSINTTTGVLTFQAGPDFESPTDADSNNDYLVQVSASDGVNTTTQDITVSVTDRNDNTPVFTSSAAASVAENSIPVMTVTATDADTGSTLIFSISGGADQTKFSIGSTTGQLAFQSAPDFENPADSDTDNGYEVKITVTDGTLSAIQTVVVTVTDQNDNNPVFTSSATASVAENQTSITTIAATDADAGTTMTFSISGGADAARFSIGGSTGALVFNSAPDFEAPADSDGNNEYLVEVSASDGANISGQVVTVTVTDVNDNSPEISSSASVEVKENKIAVMLVEASDADAGTTITYSISGGTDQALFTIGNASGELGFVLAPDFEVPADADKDNKYKVTVTANDGTNATSKDLVVSVVDENDNGPVFTSLGSASVNENEPVVMTVTATDADAGSVIAYSLSGGWDKSLFTIGEASGKLSFIAAADFEKPADANQDNEYVLQVRASDGANITDQIITVKVIDINDNAPAFTSAAAQVVAENSTSVTAVTAADADAGNTISFSLTGGADKSVFGLNSSSGALTFLVAPDFDSPGDADGDNVYEVQVSATDGTHTSTQTIVVTVTDQNDNAPVVAASQVFEIAGVAPTGSAIGMVAANDADAGSVLQAWAIAAGNDDGIFSLSAATGELTVAKGDVLAAQTTETYTLTVTVSDGELTSAEATIIVAVSRTSQASPVAVADQYSLNEDDVLTVSAPGVLGNDGNMTAQALAVRLVSAPGQGTLSLNVNGSFVYTPEADFFGTDTFSYQVEIGDVRSEVVAVTLEIAPVNDAPSAIAFRNENIPAGEPAGFKAAELITVDVDDASHSYSLVAGEGDADNDAFVVEGNMLVTSQVFDFETARVLSVRVRATDAGGAFLEKAFALQVLPAGKPEIVIPSAFTPNGDNANDTWEIENIGYYPNVTVRVYNRTGRPVFSSVGYEQSWNGERSGVALPMDTYYYVIDLNDGSGTTYKSYVMILK